MEEIPNYEVIIIGGSYAGLSAAMTLGRSLRTVLVIDTGTPCNRNSPHAHNLIGFDNEAPEIISAKAKEQVLKYHSVTFLSAKAKAISGRDNEFEVTTDNGASFLAQKVLLATGVTDIIPDIPGFAECWGKTVIHCPYCHAYEIAGKKIGILAHGEAGFEMSKLMRQWSKDISLLVNDNEPFSFEELKTLREKDIPVFPKAIDRINGEDGQVTQVVFRDGSSEDFDAIYARAGVRQSTMIPIDIGCELDDHGFIVVDDSQRTNIPGLFAAGDNTMAMRSLARSIASGNTAGICINHELIKEDF
ncbi:NAD(P)/FAD-dependent oxidoreductase [Flavobacterium sp. MAH-1]|uniref:NAD(P)/FAD-dependent oxidoreductase n=1 Tax=Flavobacterium agri TaxID=2743471 RepID=A0A7Y8Y4A1_9FLAO|nr:NAD(P)/FAD-dependent oxidoreductase [Flavobacterium agri]NUY82320.1 NAD(P)/FAD-dependent oxidoreductase [Flavobacterium agri]NYA72344.1 NAD(P)/FAD-dependent oxidoreductase [Flavobacterium agri]